MHCIGDLVSGARVTDAVVQRKQLSSRATKTTQGSSELSPQVTRVYTTRPQRKGQCIMWCEYLHSTFCCTHYTYPQKDDQRRVSHFFLLRISENLRNSNLKVHFALSTSLEIL